MKELTTYYTKKNILFKNIFLVEPKILGSRKKIKIYTAVDIKSFYWAIFKADTKSRFIMKTAEDVIGLYEKLKDYKEHNFKYKDIVITSPLCSKAKIFLQENDWRVRVDFM